MRHPPGRVTAANGNSVELTLIPTGGIQGSGSRLSLAAMQALGLSLTDISRTVAASSLESGRKRQRKGV